MKTNFRADVATESDTITYLWSVVDERGGGHIWASPHKDERSKAICGKYYGGIELHSPKPLYDFRSKPNHEHCWLLKGPCWHDGSSLQFDKEVLPFLNVASDIRDCDDIIFGILRDRLTDWFGPEKLLEGAENA